MLHFSRPASGQTWRYDQPALAAIVQGGGVGSAEWDGQPAVAADE
jgi:hypothetical protein